MKLLDRVWRTIYGETTQKGLRNAFITLIVLMFVLLGISLIDVYSLVSGRFVSLQNEIIQQAGNKLEGIVEKLGMTEKQIIYQVNTSKAFRHGGANLANSVSVRDFEYDLRNLRRVNDDISEVYVIHPESRIVLTSCVETVNKSILLEQPVLKDVRITDRFSHVTATHSADYIGYRGDDLYVISFVRMIRSLEDYSKPAAIIQVDLDYQAVSDVMRDIQLDQTQYIYLMDSDNRIIGAPDRSLLGLNTSEAGGAPVSGYDAKVGVFPMRNEILVSYQFTSVPWKLFARVDYMSVCKNILSSMAVTLLIPLFTLMFLLYLARLFSAKFSEPVRDMVAHLETEGEGLPAPIALKSGNSEMRLLARTYNRMLERIQQLIINNQIEESERASAEYRAHMAQINPHFLYNTLETMRCIAVRDGVPEMAEIAKRTAALFRYSISTKGECAMLRDEIENAKNYLYIQQQRFGGGIELFVDVAEPMMGKTVLKFSIQPMIENALEHGRRDRTGSSLVLVIRAERSGDDLVVSIHDNGKGIMPDMLEKIRSRLAGSSFLEHDRVSGEHTGIGLVNVSARLRYRFGNQYGVTVESDGQTGAVVSLRFPFELNG